MCRTWQVLANFNLDQSRGDGKVSLCRTCQSQVARQSYTQRERARGRIYVPFRDGDKKQARARINHLIHLGLLPNPNALPCFDCGDVNEEKRHEYDHYLGYASHHHEDVQPVCSACHHRRADAKVESRASKNKNRIR